MVTRLTGNISSNISRVYNDVGTQCEFRIRVTSSSNDSCLVLYFKIEFCLLLRSVINSMDPR